MSSYKVTVISVRFSRKVDFYRQIFEEKLQDQVLLKFVLWEPRYSLRTDRQTDMTKLIDAFRNFANEPKMRRALRVYRVWSREN